MKEQDTPANDAVCAAPLCTRSIADRLEAWEARGRRGRKPTYCEDKECIRARHTGESRLTRRRKTKVRWHNRDTAVWRDGDLVPIAEGNAGEADEKMEVYYVDTDTGRTFSRGSPGRLPVSEGGGGSGLSYEPRSPRRANSKPRKWVRERWPVAANLIERGEELPAEHELRESQEAPRARRTLHEHFGDEPWVRYEAHVEVLPGGERRTSLACIRVELAHWGLDKHSASPVTTPWRIYPPKGT